MTLPFGRTTARLLFNAVIFSTTASAYAIDLFSENFEGVTLKPVVTFETEIREREAWQQVGPQGPVGWTEVNLTTVNPQSPNSGVTEFAGWRFVKKDWWTLTAGDQDRSQYLNGNGIIAVADPDEWDDFGGPAGAENNLDPANGLFDSTLVTPTISLSGIGANQAKVFFHSSWRPEDFQTATLTAVYNRGTASQSSVVLRHWTSQAADADFHPDATNESLTIDLQNPATASNVQLEFRLQGNNDWWWAVDNVKVFTGSAPGLDGVLRAIIDRNTKQVRIENRTGAQVDLRGYSLRSQAGVFNEAAATFLSQTDSNWLKATQVGGDANDLSEVHLTTGHLAANGQINFGNVWQGFYNEEGDVSFQYLVAGNDTPRIGIVEYVGNNNVPYQFLDLDFNGAINILDWQAFKLGFATDLTGKTEAVRYALGDLDNDKVHTLSDFLLFQRTYDAANGQGAFVQMINGASVPEPTATILVALSVCGLALFRRRVGVRPIAVLCCLVGAGVVAPQRAEAQLTLLFEDFENEPLGHTVDEGGPEEPNGITASAVWTHSPPVSSVPTTGTGTAPWIIDDSGIPISGAPDVNGNPSNNGITEWAGWSTANKDWWVNTAGDQDRSKFSRGIGNVFIADPDEWEDGPTAPGSAAPFNYYDAHARTPVITIPAGIPAGRIKLSFDSSWRFEGFDDLDGHNNQTAVIKTIYNGGAPTEVLHWDSDPDGTHFKPDATNEHVTLDLNYNGTATTLQLEVGLENAWNDWWWAIDNVLISVPTDPAKLLINTATGQAYVAGGDVISSKITGINVTSKTGLLQTIVGGGLSHSISETTDGPDAGTVGGDSPGERWEALASNGSQFAEAYLFGNSSFDLLRKEQLGVMINAATFNQAFAQSTNDIQFTYSLATGDLVNGVVEYYFQQPSLPGDYNNNGKVDAADYVIWRNSVGTNTALPNDPIGGTIGTAQYNNWRSHFGTVAGSGAAVGGSAQVPEPAVASLLSIVFFAVVVRRARNRKALGLLTFGLSVVLAAWQSTASAALPPPPFVDRSYRFGEGDSGAVAGQQISQTDSHGNKVTFDSAGNLGQNQLIDLIALGTTPTRNATYISTTDRPDGHGGIGLTLNPLGFDTQYLRTGFGEALNFPEQSPSSSASLVNPGGTINYFRINDRGFELWVKPTLIQSGVPQYIVQDSQQHGVLIDSTGKFSMRYASKYEVTTQQLPGPDGVLGTQDDVLQTSDPVITPADYPTGVSAQANQWYHLSVVRPAGPDQGSILYINGVAQAIAFGQYAVETIVNIGEGNVFTNIDSLDISPLTVGRASTTNGDFSVPAGQSAGFFHGVVDDLRMFVMGLNDNDNISGGGVNVLNDYGEYIFQRDNGYAQTFAPTTAGDMNNDHLVTMTDANLFVSHWLYEKRMSALYPLTGQIGSRLVGDLSTRAFGDFNYDGAVDLRDWAILNNANPTVGAAAMALIASGVPEPTSVALVGLGIALLSTRRGVSCRRVRTSRHSGSL